MHSPQFLSAPRFLFTKESPIKGRCIPVLLTLIHMADDHEPGFVETPGGPIELTRRDVLTSNDALTAHTTYKPSRIRSILKYLEEKGPIECIADGIQPGDKKVYRIDLEALGYDVGGH